MPAMSMTNALAQNNFTILVDPDCRLEVGPSGQIGRVLSNGRPCDIYALDRDFLQVKEFCGAVSAGPFSFDLVGLQPVATPWRGPPALFATPYTNVSAFVDCTQQQVQFESMYTALMLANYLLPMLMVGLGTSVPSVHRHLQQHPLPSLGLAERLSAVGARIERCLPGRSRNVSSPPPEAEGGSLQRYALLTLAERPRAPDGASEACADVNSDATFSHPEPYRHRYAETCRRFDTAERTLIIGLSGFLTAMAVPLISLGVFTGKDSLYYTALATNASTAVATSLAVYYVYASRSNPS